VQAAQRVTTLYQPSIYARKPSPVSAGPLEAKGTVPYSIYHSSILLYFLLLKYCIFHSIMNSRFSNRTTTGAVQVAQKVTALDQPSIYAKKPSPISAGPLEAEGTVP
jgi:hypothetical protein